MKFGKYTEYGRMSKCTVIMLVQSYNYILLIRLMCTYLVVTCLNSGFHFSMLQ
jgi:hypothetical protein